MKDEWIAFNLDEALEYVKALEVLKIDYRFVKEGDLFVIRALDEAKEESA